LLLSKAEQGKCGRLSSDIGQLCPKIKKAKLKLEITILKLKLSIENHKNIVYRVRMVIFNEADFLLFDKNKAIQSP